MEVERINFVLGHGSILIDYEDKKEPEKVIETPEENSKTPNLVLSALLQGIYH